MSIRRALFIIAVLVLIASTISFGVWYLVRPAAQFFIYWVIAIVVGVFIAGNAFFGLLRGLREFFEKRPTEVVLAVRLESDTSGQPSSHSESKSVPFMALGLPGHYTERVNKHKELIGKLLDQTRKNSTVVLQGGPGFGKSTLASALCHDLDVINTFTDGILWITFSESGQNITSSLDEMSRKLSGRKIASSSQDEAARNFRDQLAQHRCLIVLDDVWKYEQIRPFVEKDKADSSFRLITTRFRDVFRDVADRASAELVSVWQMEPDEAVQLLLKHLPRGLEQDKLITPGRRVEG